MRTKLPGPSSKLCIACGTEFSRKKVGESYPHFAKRKFCSVACSRTYNKKHRVGLYGDCGFMKARKGYYEI